MERMGKPEVNASVAIEKELLNKVLEVAGDNENMIREGISKAIRDVQEPARRTYLWNILTKRATERIRRARRKHLVAA